MQLDSLSHHRVWLRRVGLVTMILGFAVSAKTSSWGYETPTGPASTFRTDTLHDRGEDLPGLPSLAIAPSRETTPTPLLPGAPGTALERGSNSANGANREREWRLVQGRHWQIKGPPGEAPEVTDSVENNRGNCGVGQIEVAGRMKQQFLLDELQMQACTKWIDRKWPERCAEYDRDKWLQLSKDLPTQSMRFCIDRFEYPNRKGEYPIILVSWYEARDACKAEGKRLCTEDEWTFACEGEETQPYPNGYTRDKDACLNDKPWIKFNDGALFARSSDGARQELDRLWQGLPSGARPLCKSPFGVYDMTGNIDEWTRSSIPGERPSVLKGGYWGPVRTRCRPATKAHDETHTFYQQGFRCCSDPG
jgi:sulfatase modifying factor 1